MTLAAFQALHLSTDLAIDLSISLHFLLIKHILTVFARKVFLSLSLEKFVDLDITYLLEFLFWNKTFDVIDVHAGLAVEVGAV